MSMTTPPGWYRDPTAPALERWWDGTAWTGPRRPAGASPQPPASAPVPAPSLVPVPAPAAGGSARGRAVAPVAVGAVLAAVIVTGATVLGGNGPGTRAAPGAPSTPVASPSASASAAASEAVTVSASPSPSPAASHASVVTDELNGITLPLPDGWIPARDVADHDVVMTTDGTYDCPGDPGFCRHGLVITRTATDTGGTSPEALARKDVPDAADAAYDRDTVGQRPFGGITSHRVVRSAQIAVAGRVGYLVRWRVRTADGPGGYVQSLAFPSSVGTEAPVIVRFVFDAGPDGPPLSGMDRITAGIRAVDDAAGNGGVGSSIGPSH